ncbi:MAG: hypothetical protein JWL81_3404 [Verrucomicrobiales bacterium]|nr:hypothetical protein [Verrucomicrobiales bacterium]
MYTRRRNAMDRTRKAAWKLNEDLMEWTFRAVTPTGRGPQFYIPVQLCDISGNVLLM